MLAIPVIAVYKNKTNYSCTRYSILKRKNFQ